MSTVSGKQRKKKQSNPGCWVMITPIVIALGLSFTIIFNYRADLHGTPTGNFLSNPGTTGGIVVESSVMDLIRLQNATIIALRERLEAVMVGGTGTPSIQSTLADKEVVEEDVLQLKNELSAARAEVAELRDASRRRRADVTTITTSTTSSSSSLSASTIRSWANSSFLSQSLRSAFDQDCDARFGLGLTERWRAKRETWCAMPEDSHDAIESSIHCYPYRQEHKKAPSQRAKDDMFCEGRNIFIDFSKARNNLLV